MVRIAFAEPRIAHLAPDGDGWTISIGEKLVAASEPIVPSRIIDDNGRTVVTLPLQRSSMIHWIDDPESGERLAVATALAPLRSVAKPFRFSEFERAATAHGVAVIAQADDLSVLAGVDEITIERGNGLSVTQRAEKKATDAGGIAHPVVFDRAQWTQDKAGVPRDRIRALMQNAADAPRGRRNQVRYALGRMLFANGLYVEGRSAFEAIVFTEPAAARDRALAIMRIASAVQSGRADEARKLMNDDAVRDDPESLLWRAVLDARERNWPRALAGLRAGEGALEAYPDELQAMIQLLWARAAVEVRDFGTATGAIETVEKLDREFVNANDIALIRARIDEGQGRIDDALAAYTRIFDSTHRPAAAEAGMRGALLALQDKAMTRDDAIARLETVAAIWRGDGAVEADTMAALGRFYAEDNRWRDAFAMARRANEVYPNHDRIRSLHDEAARLFESVFIDGKSDTIDRVQALALFYDFKDLTPPGRRGDEIVRQLAERLVSLDLLDNAATLLQHQIDNRLKGAQRATVAARLAIIYLMDRKPAAAAQALRSTRLPELPYHIKRARALLEARALSDLSRTDLALDIVGAESGPDVDRLTADIQWQGRRWRAAGETYERILGDRWKVRRELEDAERADVVRAAIAYALAEEPLSMDRLRGKYGALMANSADARAFQLITSPSAARAREFRELARTVARADTLAEFLSEYRKRYPDIPMTMPQREKTPPPVMTDQPSKPEPLKQETQAQPNAAGRQG
ncbi:MAG: tetratricopeptide repeat protein [Beijerinckiaceae bacterium]